MKIVVCVKQVPGTGDVKFDPETGRVVREGIEVIMNPFDAYAVEQGVLLKEAHGGEAIALSMGPRRAEQTLREALAGGADRGILLNDYRFAGSDTWATGSILAAAVERIGGVDLVLCGRQAVDGDTAQVGPAVAGHLGWPQAAFVSAMTEVSGDRVTVNRMREEGYDVCDLTLPAVITVVKDINSPRIPSLKTRLASRRAEITVWTAEDIGVDPGRLGLDGSPTRVEEIMPPPARERSRILLKGEPKSSASRLFRELRTRGLV
jgi:electron transfer flavoprotein beta subunit